MSSVSTGVSQRRGHFELGLEVEVGVFQEKMCPPERTPATSLLLCHPLNYLLSFP